MWGGKEKIMGYAILILWVAVWVGFAIYGFKKKWSGIVSIGGGFFTACAVIAIVFTLIGDNKGSTKQQTASSKPSISPEEVQRRADNQILQQIWSAYHNIPGNRGADDRNEKGRIVKRGTVPPSAMNSSVEGRLPAYVACYDFLMVTSFGDSKSHLCIYGSWGQVCEH
jgi:hypothetical protein